MFEDSLVESRAIRPSIAKRWTMAGSTALQVAIAATLVTIPLHHPERLTLHVETPLVFTPPPPRPPLPVQQPESSTATVASMDVPAAPRPISIVPRAPRGTIDTPPSIGPVTMSMGSDGDLPAALNTANGNGMRISVIAAKPPSKPFTVSTGVYAGSLLSPIRPVYPPIAKAAGVSGTVVVEAIISRTGSIESLSVVSGPLMLREAALNAIRAARYRPYLLNGEPTDIQTTFTVNFRIGG